MRSGWAQEGLAATLGLQVSASSSGLTCRFSPFFLLPTEPWALLNPVLPLLGGRLPASPPF